MSKLPTQTQSSQTLPKDKGVFPVVLKPVWEPFGEKAETVVDGRWVTNICQHKLQIYKVYSEAMASGSTMPIRWYYND